MFSSPYQNLSSQLRTRSNQNVIPSYGDETSETSMTTTTMYSQRQQQPRNTGLIATVAKQPGPTYSNYQLTTYQESDSMQTESETSGIRFARSIQPQQQTVTTSQYSTRPNFTKVYKTKTCISSVCFSLLLI
jgi:alkaline phosphatase